MRTALSLLLVAGCSSSPGRVVTADAGIVAVDAAVAADAAVVAAPTPATSIPALAMAGPFKTLAASCAAAPPCGFTMLDANKQPIDPPTQPDCTAVLDPDATPFGSPWPSFDGPGDPTLVHATGSAELRIGSVRCAVPPQQGHDEASEHYVFIKRADGWWRTENAVFAYTFNSHRCSGSLSAQWNDQSGRTLIDIAKGISCFAGSKTSFQNDVEKIKLRAEVGGATPTVLAR